MAEEARFPAAEWERKAPEEVGCSAAGMAAIENWLRERAGDEPYRVLIVRSGYEIASWTHRITKEQQRPMASAAKSVYSNLLGIAIAEGKIGSADDRVVDYYPEMMDVAEGEGPKPGRYVFGREKAITFRQLISNTSGYMKPNEMPGRVFHYQTFGMNVLTHALAKVYGLYDADDPLGLPGCGKLIEEKIRDRIGGTWGYTYTNFAHPPGAKLGIFGYYTQLHATADDMARLGYLWLRRGRWGETEVVPSEWLAESVRVAPDIRAHCPKEEWRYGLGFWTNEYGLLWPSLPTDSFAASGAGRMHIWVCPSLDLVVVQSPGLEDQEAHDRGLLRLVVDACA